MQGREWPCDAKMEDSVVYDENARGAHLDALDTEELLCKGRCARGGKVGEVSGALFLLEDRLSAYEQCTSGRGVDDVPCRDRTSAHECWVSPRSGRRGFGEEERARGEQRCGADSLRRGHEFELREACR